jgi:hypothetical protein
VWLVLVAEALARLPHDRVTALLRRHLEVSGRRDRPAALMLRLRRRKAVMADSVALECRDARLRARDRLVAVARGLDRLEEGRCAPARVRE